LASIYESFIRLYKIIKYANLAFRKIFLSRKRGNRKLYLHFSKGGKKLGNEVYVIVSNTSKKFVHERIEGIEVFRLPRIFYSLHTPFTTPFICLIGKINPDIIHLHVPNPWFEFNLFLFCILNRKAKTIVTYHSDVIWYSPFHFFGEVFRRFYLFPLLKFSKRIIATSQNYVEASSILRKFRNKVDVIPLGVDIRKFRPLRVKRPKKKLLLFLGRLFPYKGLEYLLQAIKIVSEKRKDFILYIVGEGKLRKKLEGMAKNLEN